MQFVFENFLTESNIKNNVNWSNEFVKKKKWYKSNRVCERNKVHEINLRFFNWLVSTISWIYLIISSNRNIEQRAKYGIIVKNYWLIKEVYCEFWKRWKMVLLFGIPCVIDTVFPAKGDKISSFCLLLFITKSDPKNRARTRKYYTSEGWITSSWQSMIR